MTLDWYDHQETHAVNLPTLKDRTNLALPKLLAAEPGPGSSFLDQLTEVEISLVSDAEIARIHDEFMDQPDETDVITFQHGELIVSVDTASNEATHRNSPLERELLLYVIHGLLHLHGYLDAKPDEREQMHRVQNAIIDEVWPV